MGRREDRVDDDDDADDNDRSPSNSADASREYEDNDKKMKKKKRHRMDDDSEEDSDDSHDRNRRQRREKKKHRKKKSSSREDRKKKSKKEKKKRKKKYSSSEDSSSSSDESESDNNKTKTSSSKTVVVNERLLRKLEARGETLAERKERRGQKRAAHIADKFGYTPDSNPFHDPNLHEAFTWKKKQEKEPKSLETTTTATDGAKKTKHESTHTFTEIEKVRKRRQDRELQLEEMERIRAEESRMAELEHFDEWAQKEEEFHLQQQRQRSAIRLVEGRERPVDVLAKNMLLFGLSQQEKQNRASVKYKEKFNALEAIESLEAELEEPQHLLKMLKLQELQELLVDIHAFCALEREAVAYASMNNNADNDNNNNNNTDNNPVLRYWDALRVVVLDEIQFLSTGGADGSHAKMSHGVQAIFKGQSVEDLIKMQTDVKAKLVAQQVNVNDTDASFDRQYWKSVDEQLAVYLAKAELSELHSKMLVRQLERLEKQKHDLATKKSAASDDANEAATTAARKDDNDKEGDTAPETGEEDVEEELGLTNEVGLQSRTYSWQDKYRPRKPRYFNRVKTGYDWNKYNQTHYDKDNPPPKTVQGYKFNIFYPDLIDTTKTPQFTLEQAESDEFCILRFHAGPPYEDVAFKIINREWNRSRKRGYKCTFERGVLSVYFNFNTHWYRR